MFSFGTYSWSYVIEQSSSKVLGDKTPFHHNRQDPLFTPTPQTFKIVKFALEEDEPELLWPSNAAPIPALLRPSSTRKSLRGRLSVGDGDKEKGEERFGPLGLKGLQLQTPMNPKNRHWELGDLDLEVPVETEPIAEEEDEDDDEIEYMPPKVEVPYQPPFDFEMPDYKVLGVKLREMAHSYKYEDDPVLDDFDYVFDISQAELELLNPLDPVPSSEDGDELFLEPSTSKLKPKPTSGIAKSSAAPSKIPTRKAPPVTVSSQRPAAIRTRPTVTSTSCTTTTTTRPTRSRTAIRIPTATTTTTRPTATSRLTTVTKPPLTARAAKSSATAKAISPRKQIVSRATTSQVKPMKPLVPVQKLNTTAGSSSTVRSGVVSRPPSSATTRKVGITAGTFAGKKPTGPTFKEKEDDLILKFDVQGEIEEFQFDI
ncbi:hypothetical protein BDM02DRAFT_3184894 [Thelephora ganbajun]|uniref:Uncharacterized protein n=1 Tax=Thelephora ganbajun TaxID=370292 RepID=A0ACB6ZMX8_THEGA|nr:hypothetical protein BDM02DRAFT_3184894 [Thelephora ganbajun]